MVEALQVLGLLLGHLVGIVSHSGQGDVACILIFPITRCIVSGYVLFLSKSSADMLKVLSSDRRVVWFQYSDGRKPYL